MVFASGLGATNSIVQTLESGDHIISIDDVYGGTNRYFQKIASKFGITISFCDMTEPENLRECMNDKTKVCVLCAAHLSVLLYDISEADCNLSQI